MPVVYYIVAAFLYLIVFFGKRRWDLSLLVAYMFLVLAYTVLKRAPGGDHSYGMSLFWSYRAILGEGYSHVYQTTLIIQIIANIVMYVPIGLLSGRLMKWKGIVLGFCFSALIEMIQLVTNRGLFEFDDMFHNTIGAAIGYGMLILLRRKKKS